MSHPAPTDLMSFSTERVQRYYDRHTHAFVAFGQGGRLGAMHRAIEAPGVNSKDAAFHYLEDQIIGLLRERPARGSPPHVLDLGCGVGGSVCYIARHVDAMATGVTLSATQAALGRARIARLGLSHRVQIIEGDYAAVPASVPPADVVFAIESFVHAPDPAAFFAECRRLVRPDGALVICDDFTRGVNSEQARAAVRRFRRGWHVNTLLSSRELHAMAADAGFAHSSTTDLSAYIDVGRPRDRVIGLLAGVAERLPWRPSRLDPWLGGSALQQCLRHGWIGFDLVVYRPR